MPSQIVRRTPDSPRSRWHARLASGKPGWGWPVLLLGCSGLLIAMSQVDSSPAMAGISTAGVGLLIFYRR